MTSGVVMTLPLRNRAGLVVAEALIDASDAPLVTGWAWHREQATRGRLAWLAANGVDLLYYAAGSRDGRRARLHRHVLGLTKGDGLLVDHVNGDGLDCRRSNLRVATSSANQQNRRGANRKQDLSLPRGVVRNQAGYYTAMAGGQWLGSFDSPELAEQAAVAYRQVNMPSSEMDQALLPVEAPTPRTARRQKMSDDAVRELRRDFEDLRSAGKPLKEIRTALAERYEIHPSYAYLIATRRSRYNVV